MTFQSTPSGFSDNLVEAIRRERKKGQEPAEIAATLSLPRTVVEQVLLAAWMPEEGGSQTTLRVSRETEEKIRAECRPGEPMWQAVNRMMGELIERRRGAGGRA